MVVTSQRFPINVKTADVNLIENHIYFPENDVIIRNGNRGLITRNPESLIDLYRSTPLFSNPPSEIGRREIESVLLLSRGGGQGDILQRWDFEDRYSVMVNLHISELELTVTDWRNPAVTEFGAYNAPKFAIAKIGDCLKGKKHYVCPQPDEAPNAQFPTQHPEKRPIALVSYLAIKKASHHALEAPLGMGTYLGSIACSTTARGAARVPRKPFYTLRRMLWYTALPISIQISGSTTFYPEPALSPYR